MSGLQTYVYISLHAYTCTHGYAYTRLCAHVTLDTENEWRMFQVDYDDQRSHQQLLFFLKSPHLVMSVFSVLFVLVTDAAVCCGLSLCFPGD